MGGCWGLVSPVVCSIYDQVDTARCHPVARARTRHPVLPSHLGGRRWTLRFRFDNFVQEILNSDIIKGSYKIGWVSDSYEVKLYS